jgi:hypothetical protein
MACAEAKRSIFLCYSHADSKWKDRLIRHLDTLQMIGLVETWVDTEMSPGSDWLPQIERAIDVASVAVLLISPDFLRSPFIQREEVPRLLNQRASRGLHIVPIVVESCAWQRVEWLSRLQMRPKNSIPVPATRVQRERALTDITLEIAELLEGDPKPGRSVSTVGLVTRICQGQWLKISANGHAFLFELHTDGTLTEHSLFDSSQSWKGSWDLSGNRMQLTIKTDALYVLRALLPEGDAIASSNISGRLIEGLETYTTDGAHKSTDFILVHLPERERAA